MEETIFYIGQGKVGDTHSQESVATISSLYNAKQFQIFRNADCSRNGSCATGIGPGERFFVASETKALINVYIWGKESINQRIPIPEPLNCLSLCQVPHLSNTSSNSQGFNLPSYRIPWLLAGGTKTGKLYIWELFSGNLLIVKDIQYQGINILKFSNCGTFLISAGEDSRCVVYKTIDLISIDGTQQEPIKPWYMITDHTLSVTDFMISEGILNDMKLYTVSKDSTLRVYDLFQKEIIMTFVAPDPIETITRDPAGRRLYIGLTNGKIRSIPLYENNNSVLEAVGGIGKIITLTNDLELNETFVFHQLTITQLKISMDGMNLISGDENGMIYISDIVSRQIIKEFQINSSVSFIDIQQIPKEVLEVPLINDKKTRLIRPLKRVLNDGNKFHHELYYEIPSVPKIGNNFDQWIDIKARQELDFKLHVSEIVNGNNNNNNSNINDNTQMAKLSLAYNELKSKYDELLNDHKKLLQQIPNTKN